MDRPRHVARPPARPVMLYDGDCGFCMFWVRRWRQITGDAADYISLQDERVPALYPELRRQGLEEAVHFIDATGAVSRGAEAVFRSLALNPRWRWLLRLYERFPLLARVSEGAYRLVADHRTFFSRLTRKIAGS